MVLGLIDFLLGGKKKTKVPRTAQVTSPVGSNGASSGEAEQNPANVPDGVNSPTSNANNLKFEDSTKTSSSQTSQDVQSTQQNRVSVGGKKSISEVISKIHAELKETNNRVTEMVGDIKKIENSVNAIGHRVDDLEEAKKESDEKFSEVSNNMTKFLSLYELINNQYNPFVDKDAEEPKKVVLEASGNTETSNADNSIKSFEDLEKKSQANLKIQKEDDLKSSLLELDTLNIEEAAGDAVPLTSLKNNTNSLVIILSWLEYLIKKVGIEETRNSLRYYTEVLRWITPEVYFDLDKYLRGMKDKKDIEQGASLTVRDHIVSLYFISKLNEKVLDEKLTHAVLQIIKE